MPFNKLCEINDEKHILIELFTKPNEAIPKLMELITKRNTDTFTELNRYPSILFVIAAVLYGVKTIALVIATGIFVGALHLIKEVIKGMEVALLNLVTQSEYTKALEARDADEMERGVNHLRFVFNAFSATLTRPWPEGVFSKIGSFFARTTQAFLAAILLPLAIVVEIIDTILFATQIVVVSVAITVNEILNFALRLPLLIIDGFNHLFFRPAQQPQPLQKQPHEDGIEESIDGNAKLHAQLGVDAKKGKQATSAPNGEEPDASGAALFKPVADDSDDESKTVIITNHSRVSTPGPGYADIDD